MFVPEQGSKKRPEASAARTPPPAMPGARPRAHRRLATLAGHMGDPNGASSGPTPHPTAVTEPEGGAWVPPMRPHGPESDPDPEAATQMKLSEKEIAFFKDNGCVSPQAWRKR